MTSCLTWRKILEAFSHLSDFLCYTLLHIPDPGSLTIPRINLRPALTFPFIWNVFPQQYAWLSHFCPISAQMIPLWETFLGLLVLNSSTPITLNPLQPPYLFTLYFILTHYVPLAPTLPPLPNINTPSKGILSGYLLTLNKAGNRNQLTVYTR